MAKAADTTEAPTETRAKPTGQAARITNLDAVRGVAVLGILTMNVVSYGLGTEAYFNIDAGGSRTPLDWVIGGAGEIFADQRFMGLFSMLFGAGIVLFADRAAAKGRRPALFSLWRNLLLLLIGLAHAALWDGDVLTVYALSAPVLVALRNLSPKRLVILGTAFVLLSPTAAAIAQTTIDATGSGLGGYWYTDGAMSDAVGIFLLTDFFARSIGMMLIGVALYRTGIITGERSPTFYRRMARWGLGVGLPLAAIGVAIVVANDFGPNVALIGAIPNSLGTIPATLGYLGLLTLWNLRPNGALHARIHAVGRMALTNYLSQTVIGIAVLGGFFEPADLTRTWLAVFMVAVWALQLWWSPEWLARFRYGPAEWLWRCATYRSWQPLRR